jgi:hypothetical protein
MTAYRPMVEADLEFVISGWSSSYRLYAGLFAMETYADVMHAELATILARPSTAVTIAHEPGEFVETENGPREFAYGFIATRTDLPEPYIYYVFVKGAYRRARRRLGLEVGHATSLLRAAGIDARRPFRYGAETPLGRRLVRHLPFATYDQLPARFERPR